MLTSYVQHAECNHDGQIELYSQPMQTRFGLGNNGEIMNNFNANQT